MSQTAAESRPFPEGLPHIAYVLLWYPLFTQPFIFREVEGLRRLLPLSVFTLYGRNLRQCSTEMRAAAGRSYVLGARRLFPVLGEVLRQRFLAAGIETELAGTLTSCSLIALSAVLTTLGWYQKLAARAGAGSLVPITGFANAVVSAAIEFKAEGRVLGTGAKMFTIAGPVIVYGTLAAVVYGAVLWLKGLLPV